MGTSEVKLEKWFQEMKKLEKEVEILKQEIKLLRESEEHFRSVTETATLFTSFDKERKNILVKVEDEGIGISPENLQHIIDPFFTTKRETGGMGLGLSVASTIVKEHDGSLDFKSTPNKGTIVIVALPAIDG